MIFHGEKEEVTDFHNKIKEWTSKNYQENGFGVNWLGNVVHGAGLGHRIDSTTDHLRCRGDIVYFGDVEVFKNSNSATFLLDTETAWCPMVLMWDEIIKTMGYKTVGFAYKAEEPGCEIYEVFDPYGDFTDKYYVDIFLDGEDLKNEKLNEIYDWRDYDSDDDLRDVLQALLETEEKDLKTLINLAENYTFKSENSYLYIHEYTFVDSLTA
jgi:hypothetical protein